MGYHTEFQGSFKLNKKLTKKLAEQIGLLSTTRRMARNVAPEYGVEGEFYFKDDNLGVIGNNRPPRSQPSLWCQWVPTGDLKGLTWDGGEKFYEYTTWLNYIIKNFLTPNGYRLSGTVEFQGEDRNDIGRIVVKDNQVKVERATISYRSRA